MARFSKDNQPKKRKKSNKMLTKALVKRLREMPDGEEKLRFRDYVVDIMMNELRDARRGYSEFTDPDTGKVTRTPRLGLSPATTKLIDMVFDRVDGPVKQEMEVDMTGPAVILVEQNIEDALKAYEAEEPDDDEEPEEIDKDAEPEEEQQ